MRPSAQPSPRVSVTRPPPTSTLFPYTTLFRSEVDPADLRRACEVEARGHLLHLREGYIAAGDRKSTRLNSSHMSISYAVFCLKKKTTRKGGRCMPSRAL